MALLLELPASYHFEPKVSRRLTLNFSHSHATVISKHQKIIYLKLKSMVACPALFYTVWLKTCSQSQRKKRWQSVNIVWMPLFSSVNVLHRIFQTVSLVFTQQLSLCRLSPPRALPCSVECPRPGLWSPISHSQSDSLQKEALSHFKAHMVLSGWGGWAETQSLGPVLWEGG